MAAVTQEITSYLMGVSRQPDKDKPIGFVKDARNTYPDVTFGMTKRPGMQWVREVGDSTTYADAYWFLFRYAEDESYLGAITTGGDLVMWNFQKGTPVTVTGSSSAYFSVPAGKKVRNCFKYVQKQEQLILVNQTVVTAMDFSKVAPGTVTGYVNTLAELPEATDLSVGDIYVVKGISGAADDYVLIWDGQTWEETVMPGNYYAFDATTMPHLLERTAENEFTFGVAPWKDRETGIMGGGQFGAAKRTEFIGHTISNLFFYKNRLGFLSEDAVSMSQPLDFFNFWRMSAMTQTDADPVEIIASSNRAVHLNAVLPITQGLLLFSEREQFVMTGGQAGVITPSTANVRSLSQFEMDPNIDPVMMDTTVVFTIPTPGYTRVFTMDTQGDNANPMFTDIGKIVTDWVPSGIDRVGADSQNDLVHLIGPTRKSVYLFRRYVDGGELINRSWVRWELPGNIQGLFFEQDVIWTVCDINGKMQLLSGNVNPTPASATVETADGLTIVNPCIDLLARPTDITYDSSTRLSTITFPYDHIDVAEWTPIAIQVSTNASRQVDYNEAGSYWKLTHVSGNTFTVNADLTGGTLSPSIRVGYTFPMDISLPKTYFRNNGASDFTASLIISRMKFTMGKTGAVAFEVRPRGSNVFAGVGEVEQSNWYRLDTAPIDEERMFTLPIHQRNDNFEVRISSDSPYPVSLLSMKWEGQYSPRYYARS